MAVCFGSFGWRQRRRDAIPTGFGPQTFCRCDLRGGVYWHTSVDVPLPRVPVIAAPVAAICCPCMCRCRCNRSPCPAGKQRSAMLLLGASSPGWRQIDIRSYRICRSAHCFWGPGPLSVPLRSPRHGHRASLADQGRCALARRTPTAWDRCAGGKRNIVHASAAGTDIARAGVRIDIGRPIPRPIVILVVIRSGRVRMFAPLVV